MFLLKFFLKKVQHDKEDLLRAGVAGRGLFCCLFTPKVVKADDDSENTIINTKKKVVNVPHCVTFWIFFCIFAKCWRLFPLDFRKNFSHPDSLFFFTSHSLTRAQIHNRQQRSWNKLWTLCSPSPFFDDNKDPKHTTLIFMRIEWITIFFNHTPNDVFTIFTRHREGVEKRTFIFSSVVRVSGRKWAWKELSLDWYMNYELNTQFSWLVVAPLRVIKVPRLS